MTENTQNTNVGSSIVALAGFLSRSYGKQVTGKAIRCQIALEKQGIIRPIAERVEKGLTLTVEAVKGFNKLAKAGDEGAARVVEMHKALKARHAEIKAFKASADVPSAE